MRDDSGDTATVLKALRKLREDELRGGAEFEFMPEREPNGDVEPDAEPDEDEDDAAKVRRSGRSTGFPVGRLPMMSQVRGGHKMNEG